MSREQEYFCLKISMIEICCPREKIPGYSFSWTSQYHLRPRGSPGVFTLPARGLEGPLVGTNILQQTTSSLPKLPNKRVPLVQACGGLERNRVKSFPTFLHMHAEAMAEARRRAQAQLHIHALGSGSTMAPGSFCLFQDTDQAEGI